MRYILYLIFFILCILISLLIHDDNPDSNPSIGHTMVILLVSRSLRMIIPASIVVMLIVFGGYSFNGLHEEFLVVTMFSTVFSKTLTIKELHQFKIDVFTSDTESRLELSQKVGNTEKLTSPFFLVWLLLTTIETITIFMMGYYIFVGISAVVATSFIWFSANLLLAEETINTINKIREEIISAS